MGEEGWRDVEAKMRVVSLSLPTRLLVPALLVSAFPLQTRGVSYERGKFGVAVGGLLVGGAVAIGWALYGPLGIVGAVVPFWVIGSAGMLLIVNEVRPTAFVKPICVKCRLLPIIKEHEAIHMAGVRGDDQVWRSMKTRHSPESLRLKGDPTICLFCPIPKRLEEE